ncbi:hypothetical protein J4416_02695 [Candidatus Pacearchaeota archaeon]|nr:hypothetical protein [Candidatus Pacearchaeota archaeon]
MSKIKEIRKIEHPIKEIKKDKIESLDDEFEEDDSQHFVNGSRIRGFGKSSTLDTSETSSDPVFRERRVAKEDEEEISFRPSYTGGAQDQKSKYTPVGSSESSGVSQTRVLGGERSFEQRSDLQQNQNMDDQRGGEMEGARAYVEEKKRDRRNTI